MSTFCCVTSILYRAHVDHNGARIIPREGCCGTTGRGRRESIATFAARTSLEVHSSISSGEPTPRWKKHSRPPSAAASCSAVPSAHGALSEKSKSAVDGSRRSDAPEEVTNVPSRTLPSFSRSASMSFDCHRWRVIRLRLAGQKARACDGPPYQWPAEAMLTCSSPVTLSTTQPGCSEGAAHALEAGTEAAASTAESYRRKVIWPFEWTSRRVSADCTDEKPDRTVSAHVTVDEAIIRVTTRRKAERLHDG